uniref:CCHC-type domain-containing protein n=1 Tax=Ditylenchus dipsaci TaxID=166011 RepID=A0A915DF32_9BILA
MREILGNTVEILVIGLPDAPNNLNLVDPRYSALAGRQCFVCGYRGHIVDTCPANVVLGLGLESVAHAMFAVKKVTPKRNVRFALITLSKDHGEMKSTKFWRNKPTGIRSIGAIGSRSRWIIKTKFEKWRFCPMVKYRSQWTLKSSKKQCTLSPSGTGGLKEGRPDSKVVDIGASSFEEGYPQTSSDTEPKVLDIGPGSFEEGRPQGGSNPGIEPIKFALCDYCGRYCHKGSLGWCELCLNYYFGE